MTKWFVFRFLLIAPAGETTEAETADDSGPGQIHRHSPQPETAYPAHTCVDQPILPCPACLKWTGDGFATVRSTPRSFPAETVTSVTSEDTKTQINRSHQGNSYLDRRTDMQHLPSSYAAPPSHETPKSINDCPNSALVVEPYDSLVDFFIRCLRERGYTIRTARDGEEGLRLYRDCSPFSVVFIDYFVPRTADSCIDFLDSQTHWAELVRSIREINRSQSIIVAAFAYRNEDEVPRPSELSAIPLLTDTSDFRLQKLLEKVEVERAVDALTQAELLQLKKYAASRIQIIGRAARGRTGEDLLNEALLRTLIGTLPNGEGRHWNKKVNFFRHLDGAMRSISSYWTRKFDQREAYLEAEILPKAGTEEREFSPLENVASGQTSADQALLANEQKDRILALFKNDFEATAVLRGLADGVKKNEIKQQQCLSEWQWQAILRRIRLRVLRAKEGFNEGRQNGR